MPQADFAGFSNRKAITALVALALAGLSSCKLARNMNEMHDKTLEMAGTTDSVKETTCVTYRSLRQGQTKDSRTTDIRNIQEGKGLEDKLPDASTYMRGFEYQAWWPKCEDGDRDTIIDMAANELLTKTQPFMADRSDVSPIAVTNDKETLLALAATLHHTNTLQESLLKGTPYKVLRPFDILVQGLDYTVRYDRGENVGVRPVWAVTVGKYKNEAVYLLRLRQNFLMLYAFALVDGDNSGNSLGRLEKAKLLYQRFSEGNLFEYHWSSMRDIWTPNLTSRGATEIEEKITPALNYAIETNQALRALGIDPMMSPVLSKIWARADFSDYNPSSLEKSGQPELAKAVKGLIAARDQIVDAYQKGLSKK